MAELTQKVIGVGGKEVGSVTLDPAVFAVKPREALVHQAVLWQRAKRQAGTHSTLTKGQMKGGNRKPWRQKGTGQARSGSNTSPIWVGGAVAHGPQPRSHARRMGKRMRREALASVLSEKLKNGQLIVVDQLVSGSTKTKAAVALLKDFGVSSGLMKKGVAIVFSGKDAGDNAEAVKQAYGNLPSVLALPVIGVNPYDLLKCRTLVGSKQAVLDLQARILSNCCSKSCENKSCDNKASKKAKK